MPSFATTSLAFHSLLALSFRAAYAQDAVIELASGPKGLTPLDTLYPRDLANISYITNASLGTYGGVYHATVRSANTSAPYGSFDFCSMPHPRASEYVKPGPVANGSVRAELVYLEYIQRHQRRTPYGLPPGGENEPFKCDNVQPFLYAGPTTGEAPIPVYASTYNDVSNPFVQNLGFDNDTCQFPQITVGGVLDGITHGRDLWSVYGDLLKFLPSQPNHKTWFRSSESPLTQATAGAVLRGLWPNYNGALPLHQQNGAVDSVNEGYPCASRSTILSSIESTPKWNAHLTATEPLLNALEYLTLNNTVWNSSFDALTDYFQCRLCNGYSLPCDPKDPSKCVTHEQAEEVFRAGDWEWNYWFGADNDRTDYIQTVEGLFVGEIITRLEQVRNGTQSIDYAHVFVHDNDVGPILGALGTNVMRWPALGSNVAFEVWKTSSGAFYARVLYSGQPLITVHGVLDWIALDDLIDNMAPYVPADIIALCNN